MKVNSAENLADVLTKAVTPKNLGEVLPKIGLMPEEGERMVSMLTTSMPIAESIAPPSCHRLPMRLLLLFNGCWTWECLLCGQLLDGQLWIRSCHIEIPVLVLPVPPIVVQADVWERVVRPSSSPALASVPWPCRLVSMSEPAAEPQGPPEVSSSSSSAQLSGIVLSTVRQRQYIELLCIRLNVEAASFLRRAGTKVEASRVIEELQAQMRST